MIIFHAESEKNCELYEEEEIFVDGILNFSHCLEKVDESPTAQAQVHNFNFKETFDCLSRVHIANDDEKVIEDEIAFFMALISYSTFYSVAHYFSFLPHDPNMLIECVFHD